MTLCPLPSPYPETVFMFGGKLVPTRRVSAEMWALDLASNAWSRVNAGPGPSPRYFHSMDVWQDKLVCFGGMADGDSSHIVHKDLWFFDCRSRRWLPQPSPDAGPSLRPIQDPQLRPTARYAHLTAISRDQLVVCGGQRGDNTWIYELNVYDLKSQVWVSNTEQPESHGLHSKGAYRSCAMSSTQRVVVPIADSHTITGAQALPYSVEEQGSGGDIYCYSNYDFAKVRREFEVLRPLDGQTAPPTASDKFVSPPDYMVRDISSKMAGVTQPPGLRFPSGSIVGHHFVLTGLYLASTTAAFSIWVLDLTTMVWRHIEPVALATGSWNRSVLCPDTGRLLVFGNAESDLLTDYAKRAVNLDHMAVVDLEAYGVYRPPKLVLAEKVQETGLTMLDEKLVSDFEVVAEDGRRIRCSRKVLSERWPWFADELALLSARAGEIIHDIPAPLDINDAPLGSLSPARVTPSRIHIPEPFAVCVALVQYFYTLSLTTPLQNRSHVLTALLFLAKQYKIDRLRKLVLHALHSRLEPSVATGVYEVATLAGEHALQARALMMVHQAKNAAARGGHNPRRPGSAMTNYDGSTNHTPQSTNGALPETQGQAPSSGTSNNGGLDENYIRRARVRPDSFIMPKHVQEATIDPLPHLLEAEDNVQQLLDALDIDTDVPVSPVPFPPTKSSSTFLERANSPASFSKRRNPLNLPPMLPPPDRPLPIRPPETLLTPITPLTDDTLRASSPTNSDSNSAFYPRTPSESHRDSIQLSREHSPMVPSPSPSNDRRSSFSGSMRSKRRLLPSLPEDSTHVESDAHSVRFSTASESSLSPPSVDTCPSSAPISTPGTLGSQQDEALATLRAIKGRTGGGAKLTRAVSLNSLASRPQSLSIQNDYLAVHQARDGSLTASHKVNSMHILSEAASDYEHKTTTVREEHRQTWSQRLDDMSAHAQTFDSRPTSPPVSINTMSDNSENEQERLIKFQAFIAEQQRQAGFTTAEAMDRAKRATITSPPRSRLGRLGAKFADAILHG